MNQINKIIRHVSEHGLFSIFLFFFDYIRNQIITRLRLGSFQLRNIYIGPSAILRGLKFIRIGSSFYAKDMLWLDAIERFGNEKFRPQIKIGSRVSISRNVHIAAISQITIGNDVLIGSNVLITDHSHGDSHQGLFLSTAPALRPLVSKGPIIIGCNVWIGDGAVILGGVCIGDGAIIGGNAVVTKNVPMMTIVAGVPARRI
jgi:lipopolysaccharide O-acetyltransferase